MQDSIFFFTINFDLKQFLSINNVSVAHIYQLQEDINDFST